MNGNDHPSTGNEQISGQPAWVEARLLAIEEKLATLTTVNQRLAEEIATLRQGLGIHAEAVTKLERGARHDRWWRRFWLVVRLLVFLALLAALAYFLLDWQSVWLMFV